MTTPRFLAVLFLLFTLTASAAPPPELTVLRQQYEKVFAERVTVPFDTALGELNARYSAGLDRAIADAKPTGNLESILTLEVEKKRLTDKLPVPDAEGAAEPESLKKLRAIYREQHGALTATKARTQADLLPPYTAKLKDLEAILVKNDRIAEAKEVLIYRQGLGADLPAAVPAPPNSLAPPKEEIRRLTKLKTVEEFSAWLKTTTWQNAEETIYRFPEDDVVEVTKKFDNATKYTMAIEEVGVMAFVWSSGLKAVVRIDKDLKTATISAGLPLTRLEKE